MSVLQRYIEKYVLEDMRKKMVFIGGPRQVGKTTFARTLKNAKQGYLNYDIPEDREIILENRLPGNSIWVFDELHKYRKWRQFLKGLFDKDERKHGIIVTGSARLDLYRYGGDSLQGRYHFWRMHPFTVAELKISNIRELKHLLLLGGFPEPYLEGSEKNAKRWSREYRTRLIEEDILGVENIKDIGTLELLVLRLPELVGSPISINSIREDLQVNHKTVDRWLNTLEKMYGIFRIAPFGAPQIRAVKKEQKHYHYDWTLVKAPGPNFENFIAVHLLKWVHFLQDSEGRDIELRYFRDTDGREVDFIVVEEKKPILAVECKRSDMKVSSSIQYFKNKFKSCECIQLVLDCEKPYITPDGIKVESSLLFLSRFI